MKLASKKRVMAFVGLFVLVSMMLACFAFANGSESATSIANAVSNGLSKVYKILLIVVLPIGVVAIAVCAVKMIWGDSKSAETAKGTMIRIAIALALVFLAPLVIKEVSGWFQGTATTNNWQTMFSSADTVSTGIKTR